MLSIERYKDLDTGIAKLLNKMLQYLNFGLAAEDEIPVSGEARILDIFYLLVIRDGLLLICSEQHVLC